MSNASTPAIRIQDLHTWYGESHILHGVNIDVQPGEVVSLLGRNGAGRTTTLRAIMGLTGKRTGSIQVNGVETIKMAPHRSPAWAWATARKSAPSWPRSPARKT